MLRSGYQGTGPVEDMKIDTARFAAVCAFGFVLLAIIYGAVLALGFRAAEAPDVPLADPYFTILEIIILLMSPLLMVIFAIIHVQAPAAAKVFSTVSLVFSALLVGTTFAVHFLILTISRQPSFEALAPLLFSFTWPSLAYALDILAWDIFFALAALFAIPAISGGAHARTIRILLLISSLLAFAGLSGVYSGNMQLRNIGILGYLGAFPIATVFLGLRFSAIRQTP